MGDLHASVLRICPVQRALTIQERRRLYEHAVAVMMSEYATELAVDSVAQRVFSSRRQLQRVFFDAGTTFRTVCRQIRMAEASKLLSESPPMTVREVANAVGYRQPAQFAKAFQREVGMPPTEFRISRRQSGVVRDLAHSERVRIHSERVRIQCRSFVAEAYTG